MKRLSRTVLVILLGHCSTVWTEPLQDATVSQGTFTPGAPPQHQDRKQGSKVAAKAAAAGSAMDRVMCLMMMQQAMEEKDPNQKTMMMMMAMQMCAQANQMDQSAAANDKGYHVLSDADIPTEASFQAGKMDWKTSNLKETAVTYNDSAPTNPGAMGGDLPIVPAGADSTGATSPVSGSGPVQAGMQRPSPTSVLSPISPDKGTAGQNANSLGNPMMGSSGMMPFGMGMGMGMGMGNTGAKPGDLSSMNSAPASAQIAKMSKRAPATDAGAAGASAGEDRASENGGDAMNALMSQLMGGEPPADGESLGTMAVLAQGDARPDESNRTNIFEYASVRYQKLHVSESRLGQLDAAKSSKTRVVKGL